MMMGRRRPTDWHERDTKTLLGLYKQGMTYDQICDVMNRSRGTVMRHISALLAQGAVASRRTGRPIGSKTRPAAHYGARTVAPPAPPPRVVKQVVDSFITPISRARLMAGR